MTISKDTKTPEERLNLAQIQIQSLDEVSRQHMEQNFSKKLHEFASYKKQFMHKDLNPSRTLKNEKDVNAFIKILSDAFTSHFSDNPLLCISYGTLAWM